MEKKKPSEIGQELKKPAHSMDNRLSAKCEIGQELRKSRYSLIVHYFNYALTFSNFKKPPHNQLSVSVLNGVKYVGRKSWVFDLLSADYLFV